MNSEVRTYVLVHGAFHGGWCWKSVAAHLRARGHLVCTPTLTGLGERSHLMALRPTVATFAEDIAQVIRFEELGDVILVGHSFGGSVVSLVADRMAERLRHLVYLDAMVLRSGQCPADICPPGHIDRYAGKTAAADDWPLIPPSAPEYYGITEPAQMEWLRGKLTPQPLRSFQERLVLNHPLGNGVPATYIACSDPYFATTARSRELARRMPGWKYLEIPTAHDAMLLKPGELAGMLGAIG